MTEQEFKVALSRASGGALLAMIAAIVADPDYIENVGDGHRMQYTIEHIISRGTRGEFQSKHLYDLAFEAYGKYMNAPIGAT